MTITPFSALLALFLVAFQIAPIGQLRAQVPGTAGHEHLTEVACVDGPPGEKRPEFGCLSASTATRANARCRHGKFVQLSTIRL